ncbi:MAG: HMA2 domain-containing protein [Dakarella massiliensis]
MQARNTQKDLFRMNLTVVHHIPGRIRWRSANCFTRSLAETIAEKLDAIAGVEGVRVSPRCGSILIAYSTGAGAARCG